MTKEYVKHNRAVTPENLQKYGKLANHDIHVPILVLYELGNIKDKNGIEVNIDKDFINETMRVSNEAIKIRHKSPFAKLKSIWSKAIDEVEAIPIIKNHDTADVDGLVGHTKGLFYTDIVEDKLALLIMGIIKDPQAKMKVDDDLLRNTSMGSRADGSIKEISFVINEAVPHGGLVMSELTQNAQLQTTQELQLAEDIPTLQLQLSEFEQTIIPNHLILSRLIKNGKLAPYKYDTLITSNNREALELLEHSAECVNLGIIYGTNKSPQSLQLSELKTANQKIDDIISNWKQKNGGITPAPHTEIIQQNGQNFAETRQKELKHILELAQYSPELAAKYIKCELGEDVDNSKYRDTLLTEYLSNVTTIKTKLKELQLGEINND